MSTCIYKNCASKGVVSVRWAPWAGAPQGLADIYIHGSLRAADATTPHSTCRSLVQPHSTCRWAVTCTGYWVTIANPLWQVRSKIRSFVLGEDEVGNGAGAVERVSVKPGTQTLTQERDGEQQA